MKIIKKLAKFKKSIKVKVNKNSKISFFTTKVELAFIQLN